jgi:hypothetical protein
MQDKSNFWNTHEQQEAKDAIQDVGRISGGLREWAESLPMAPIAPLMIQAADLLVRQQDQINQLREMVLSSAAANGRRLSL